VRSPRAALRSVWTRSTGVRDSLSFRVVAIVIGAEVVFGLLVGAVVSLYSLRNAAEERLDGLRHISSVVAASLMPVVADQDRSRVDSQLHSILLLDASRDIQCIRVVDGTGGILAESEQGCTCDLVPPSTGALAAFTAPQVVVQPIVIDGQRIGEVSVQFRPVGLENAFAAPMRTTALVVLAAVLISALWGVWLTLDRIVGPIGELRDGANRIAGGARNVDFGMSRTDEIGQLASSLEDMTRQFEMQEDRLRDSYDSLRSAYFVQERITSDLEESMHARSEFVAVASHELRSPVSVVRVCAEMLEDGQYGPLDPRTLEAVKSIRGASERLGAIVSDLTDAALADRGQIAVELTRVSLLPIVRGATHDAAVLGRDRGVSVAFVGRPRAATVRGDAIRLRQVFDNVLLNALKYSPAGGHVSVAVDVDADTACVSIGDQGPGIPVERREMVFEPFGRVETGDSSTSDGLGLGLAISMRIVRAHGGDIELRDGVAGVGSTFVIRLPLAGDHDESGPRRDVRVA
jgi:signal transduction histidine kinase